MGHCYNRDGAILCDGCGSSAGVKKRKCPEIVDGLPWCTPHALCEACFEKCGGTKGLHAKCKEPAEYSRQKSKADAARIEAGDSLLATAWGDWHGLVSHGKVGLRFVGKGGVETFLLVSKEDHDAIRKQGKLFMSDFQAVAEPWYGHPDLGTTKRVM